MILFVQPFGLGSPGGGARIMRALLDDAPIKWLSVAATPNPTPPPPFGKEIHLQGRPYFGRLERTRFSHWFQNLDGWAGSRLETKLNQIIKQYNISAVHAIAHCCWDMLAAFKIAKRYGLPFFLSVHDDPAYCLKGHPLQKKLLPAVMECWREADIRFVISEEMGEELCCRWCKKDYILVTDGLTDVTKQPRPLHPNRLSVYFMGLLHLSYEPNFFALQKALQIISRNQPELKIRLLLRGGIIRREAIVFPEILDFLPFANESEIQSDLENMDVLYQPLSLDPADFLMTAYSLSTKMITYLGSGLPILFHGPSDSAAGRLLTRNYAAFICSLNDSHLLAKVLARAISPERDAVVSSALNLAKQQFPLSEIQGRFWNAIKNN